jgi:hypothetical protein
MFRPAVDDVVEERDVKTVSKGQCKPVRNGRELMDWDAKVYKDQSWGNRGVR